MSDAASPPPQPLHPRAPSPLPPDRPKRGDLVARLATAAVLIPPVLYVIVQGGLWVLAVVVATTLLAQREFYRLIEDKGVQPIVGFGLAAGSALPVVAYLGNEYHATVLMTVTLLAVMIAQLRRRRIADALASISGTFFGVFYVGWLLSHAVVLRNFHEQVVERYSEATALQLHFVPDSGAFLLVFTLVAVVLCDSGAYFAGRAYGKRKLAPAISPGKTLEGALGGLLAGTLGALFTKLLFDSIWPELSQGLSWQAAGLFGLLVSMLGMVGDLVESLLKRDAQVKDAGSLLPGMGGILDRIDASLLGIPGMYYLMLFYVYLQVNV